jgi:peroxiredoxin
MQQLGELRQLSTAFAEHHAQVLVVFRESDKGTELLTELADRFEIPQHIQLAIDPGAEQTAAWSRDGYHSYVIDDQGMIRRVLQGSTTDRPHGAEILSAVTAVAGDE